MPARISDVRRRRLSAADQSGLEQWFDRHASLLAGAFVIVFVISGILTLHNYGFTWDESLGNLFYGERYLHFFTSFDPRFLNFSADLPILHQYPLHLTAPFGDPPYIFPPLADTLSVACMYVFSYWLKWLNPIDGFHLFTIFLAGLFLWTLYRFLVLRLGKYIAFLAILFLGTFPRFWGDMHFNVKDVPEAVFFGWALMAYWSWYEKPAWKKALAAGLLTGCTLAVKANALFIPVVLILVILPWSRRLQPWLDVLRHLKKYLFHYALMALSAVALYILSWPYLYANVYLGLKAYWGFIFHLSTKGSLHWQIDPIRQTLTIMPEVMLILSFLGLVLLVYKAIREKAPFYRLLLLWVAVPILRVSVPSAVNFDGIRHFLEFVPAAAVIAAVGADQFVRWIAARKWLPQFALQVLLVAVIVANLVQINLLFYPYLHLYYNQFTGGLSGARDSFLGREATDYWAVSYRPGMEWLNENAPPNAKLVVPVAGWVANLEAPLLLRPDIQIVQSMPDGSVMQASKDPYYIMFILRGGLGSAEDEVDYTMGRGELVHQIFVDRVPVLYFYRFGGD